MEETRKQKRSFLRQPYCYKPFPSYLFPLFQNLSYENDFICMKMKLWAKRFHISYELFRS